MGPRCQGTARRFAHLFFLVTAFRNAKTLLPCRSNKETVGPCCKDYLT